MALTQLVNQYLNSVNTIKFDSWVNETRRYSSAVDRVIEIAISSENRRGELSPHQYLVGRDLLDKFSDVLHAYEKELEITISLGNFHKIYEFFWNHKIDGIGQLTIYDVCLRIGMTYNIKPEFVYLHQGTRTGARNLGFTSANSDYLTRDEITRPELLAMDSADIENFLCIYADQLYVGMP